MKWWKWPKHFLPYISNVLIQNSSYTHVFIVIRDPGCSCFRGEYRVLYIKNMADINTSEWEIVWNMVVGSLLQAKWQIIKQYYYKIIHANVESDIKELYRSILNCPKTRRFLWRSCNYDKGCQVNIKSNNGSSKN